ncbi:MAG: glycosyltransferase family 2 protein [Dissulfurispiraceae bacterium]|jgi:glycosyltransferase involved in cell wall biosynthesis|nr:glycosyltransferase family 2 protein [Dissulfurispiraceae bacterium]
MKVSVIISTYNRPHYLKKVISGYLRQTRLPDEIVIADDGSTQETAEMIRNISATSPVAIKHVWHEDKGFRAASIRNRAAAESEGDYLIFCDDDSMPTKYLVKDHVEHREKGFLIQGHRVLLGPSISNSLTVQSMPGFFQLLKLSLKNEASNITNCLRLPFPLVRVSQKLRGIRSCNMSLYKSDFISVNGFNEDFEGWGKEDSELVVRLYKLGIKRLDIKFRCACYHLFHEHYDRANLEKNTALLKKAEESSRYYCNNGVDKHIKAL